jgi:hypothetical protein
MSKKIPHKPLGGGKRSVVPPANPRRPKSDSVGMTFHADKPLSQR